MLRTSTWTLLPWWCYSLIHFREWKIWKSLNQFLLWGLTLDNLCVWERQQPLILKGKFPLGLFLLQLSLSKLLILASSWNEFLLLWTSLGSLLLQLGFCSWSLVLLPDLTERALFIVKSLWWCHWPSWFQSVFKQSTVEAGLWLCKLSFAGPDWFRHKTSYIQC